MMISPFPFRQLAVVLTALILTLPISAQAQRVFSDFGSAESAAKAAGKPLLVIFEQEGCPDCARLESALRGGTAQAALNDAIIAKLMYQDFPRIAARYNVKVTPTTVLVDTRRGSVVLRREGSMGSGELVALGRRISGMSRGASANTDDASEDRDDIRSTASNARNGRERSAETDADVEPTRQTVVRRESRRERLMARQQELAQQAEEATVEQSDASSAEDNRRYYLLSWW